MRIFIMLMRISIEITDLKVPICVIVHMSALSESSRFSRLRHAFSLLHVDQNINSNLPRSTPTSVGCPPCSRRCTPSSSTTGSRTQGRRPASRRKEWVRRPPHVCALGIHHSQEEGGKGKKLPCPPCPNQLFTHLFCGRDSLEIVSGAPPPTFLLLLL